MRVTSRLPGCARRYLSCRGQILPKIAQHHGPANGEAFTFAPTTRCFTPAAPCMTDGPFSIAPPSSIAMSALKVRCCPKQLARKLPRDVHEDACDVARRLMRRKAFLKSCDERKRPGSNRRHNDRLRRRASRDVSPPPGCKNDGADWTEVARIVLQSTQRASRHALAARGKAICGARSGWSNVDTGTSFAAVLAALNPNGGAIISAR